VLSVFWTERALSDLEAIADYIARDDEGAAERWVMKPVDAADKAAHAPLAGRRVPEIGREDVREIFLRTYRIVYRVGPSRVELLTVFEGSQLFPNDVSIP
jgi:plasmid stabilization system protein ParE